tara:strand:+ start:786 stop:1253 length:468 start_codon:yes stop_codon:yes gene_type:complete
MTTAKTRVNPFVSTAHVMRFHQNVQSIKTAWIQRVPFAKTTNVQAVSPTMTVLQVNSAMLPQENVVPKLNVPQTPTVKIPLSHSVRMASAKPKAQSASLTSTVQPTNLAVSTTNVQPPNVALTQTVMTPPNPNVLVVFAKLSVKKTPIVQTENPV